MCGIAGYIGKKKAGPIILDSLKRLEYRGYDSSGIAVFDGENINMKKAKGRLSVLSELTNNGEDMQGCVGIGHTRWATHGKPSNLNAHPHLNKDNSIAVVHNGIINNFSQIRESLINRGYEFTSDTDTEVIAHMLDFYMEDDPIETISHVLHRLDGSYALGIIFKSQPNKIFAARKNSPLIVGKNDDGSFIASDVPAILKYTRDVYYVDNDEIVELEQSKITFYNLDREELQKELKHIEWDAHLAEKSGYEHFMLKEIYEQPKAVKDTLFPRIKKNSVDLSEINFSKHFLKNISSICIVACGSSWHVGNSAKYIIEELIRIPVSVELASEFRYRNPIIDKNELIIFISQSGETADTLESLRSVKDKGCKTLSIVNVIDSSLARESDHVLYTYTGPEIAVATTKAYSAQLIAIYLLALYIGKEKGKINSKQEKEFISYLEKLPSQIEKLLEQKEELQKFANRYLAAKNVFFMGRGIDYAISMEGSLKLKEISYISSESYAAGELKHGTISLIEEGTLVNVVATQDTILDKTLSNALEVKSRGAFVMAVAKEGETKIEDVADYVIYIPKTHHLFTNSLAIIPLQLFSYYISIGKGIDPDHPRNLAKSVTVE